MQLDINWRQMFENCETGSNIIIDENNNIIFYCNQYADDMLKERKNGRLLCYSLEGEEKWSFAFPDRSYIYFTGKIMTDGEYLHIVADSNRLYDSGFERGLYVFDKYGNYIKNYTPQNYSNAPRLNKVIEMDTISTELCAELEKRLSRKIISSVKKENMLFICISDVNGFEVFRANLTLGGVT